LWRWASHRASRFRDLRFHDLRHTFGTQVIGKPRVSILQLREWMGHTDIDTTMKYLHFVPRAGDADLIAQAFAAKLDAASARAQRGARTEGGIPRRLVSRRIGS
jgi:integrase